MLIIGIERLSPPKGLVTLFNEIQQAKEEIYVSNYRPSSKFYLFYFRFDEQSSPKKDSFERNQNTDYTILHLERGDEKRKETSQMESKAKNILISIFLLSSFLIVFLFFLIINNNYSTMCSEITGERGLLGKCAG